MRVFLMLLTLTWTAIVTAQTPRGSGPVSPAEAREFGEELEREFKENGPDFFVKAIDVGRIVDIATQDQPGSNEVKEGFRTGVMSGGFGANLAKSMAGFRSYKFLRTVTTSERPQLVFRCLTPEGAMNYHILELERPRSARIRIVDMFVMISGEKMSETFRRLYLTAAAEADRSLLSRLALGKGDWIKYGKDVQEMTRLNREGDYKGVLKRYDALPESLRSEKSLLVIRLAAAGQADEKSIPFRY